jgi:hypothetical protein
MLFSGLSRRFALYQGAFVTLMKAGAANPNVVKKNNRLYCFAAKEDEEVFEA